MTDDDEHMLQDLREAEEALILAHQALTRLIIGIGGQEQRDLFVFNVGLAQGRLMRIAKRIRHDSTAAAAGSDQAPAEG